MTLNKLRRRKVTLRQVTLLMLRTVMFRMRQKQQKQKKYEKQNSLKIRQQQKMPKRILLKLCLQSMLLKVDVR